MRVLIAPGPYKECLDARSVAQAIALGVAHVIPDAEIVLLPICDGGTGLVDRLIEARGGQKILCQVHDPLMNRIDSHWGCLTDGTAVIESASAAGLALVPRDRRNPLLTTTYGVGELIKAAVNYGSRKLLIGCGDSATNDGGVGMAQALGIKFYDSTGRELAQGASELIHISAIDPTRICIDRENLDVTVACNITSILCGPEGTSRRYAKQKGATPDVIEQLDECIEHYADALSHYLEWDLRYMPGTGAAGGLGAGLLAFTGAKLRYSMEIVARALNIDRYLQNTDLLITGEGMIDGGSTRGKVTCSIGLMAKKYGIPTLAIVGAIGDDADIAYYHGIDLIESTVSAPMTLEAALDPDFTRTRVVESTIRIMRSLKRGALVRKD